MLVVDEVREYPGLKTSWCGGRPAPGPIIGLIGLMGPIGPWPIFTIPGLSLCPPAENGVDTFN